VSHSPHPDGVASNANSNSCSFSNFPTTYQDSTGKGKTLFTGSYNFQMSEVEVYGKQ